MLVPFLSLGFLLTGSGAVSIFNIDDDLLNLALSPDSFQAFHQWMNMFGKDYGNILTTWTKYKVFKDNAKRAMDLNLKHQGLAIFGLTQFADLTPDEFSYQYLIDELEKALNETVPMFNPDGARRYGAMNDEEPVTEEGFLTPPSTTPPTPPSPPPDSFDWTEKGVVTPVKDQGHVGTCYIFSALAVIESRWAQKGNPLTSLSAEQVADCLAAYGGIFSDVIACGVNGGTQPAVYKYVKDEGGIEPEEAYPYCVGNGECRPCEPEKYPFLICGTYPIDGCRKHDSCDHKLNRSLYVPGLKVRRWSSVSKNEDKIRSALAEEGPLSTALDATDLQLYQGGILKPDQCKPNGLNHAVTFVGYGEENGVKYWKLKNSWGEGFGEKGYFRIIRDEGACGINMQVHTVDLE